MEQVPGWSRGALQVGEEAQASQHGGIEVIILGGLAEELGAAPRAQGVDHDRLETGLGETLVEGPLVAPGGLEDNACDALLVQPVAQSATPEGGIGEVASEAARQAVDIQSMLADIDAGDWNGSGFGQV